MSSDLDPKPHPEILDVALVSLRTLLMSCHNASCTAGGVTGRCLRWLHPREAKCASSLSASAVMREGRRLFWLDLIWICPGSRRAVEAVFDLGSTWIFTLARGELAGRRAGGREWRSKTGWAQFGHVCWCCCWLEGGLWHPKWCCLTPGRLHDKGSMSAKDVCARLCDKERVTQYSMRFVVYYMFQSTSQKEAYNKHTVIINLSVTFSVSGWKKIHCGSNILWTIIH